MMMMMMMMMMMVMMIMMITMIIGYDDCDIIGTFRSIYLLPRTTLNHVIISVCQFTVKRFFLHSVSVSSHNEERDEASKGRIYRS